MALAALLLPCDNPPQVCRNQLNLSQSPPPPPPYIIKKFKGPKEEHRKLELSTGSYKIKPRVDCWLKYEDQKGKK